MSDYDEFFGDDEADEDYEMGDEMDGEAIGSEDSEHPLTITVGGYQRGELAGWLVNQMKAFVKKIVDRRVDSLVTKAVEAKLDALSTQALEARLQNELDICLEEGWQRTDNYGQACGGKVTLKTRISDWLEHNTGSYSNSNKQRRIDAMLKPAIEWETKKAVDAEVARLKDHLTAEVDAALAEKARGALRGILGLK